RKGEGKEGSKHQGRAHYYLTPWAINTSTGYSSVNTQRGPFPIVGESEMQRESDLQRVIMKKS
ncbi:MAG: hypothetical protein ABSA33_04750, partial [Candidatus Micrarchaeaceae archaeon]